MMLSVEENDSLLRVGVAFQSMEARHRVSEALERNYERRKFKDLMHIIFNFLNCYSVTWRFVDLPLLVRLRRLEKASSTE